MKLLWSVDDSLVVELNKNFETAIVKLIMDSATPP